MSKDTVLEKTSKSIIICYNYNLVNQVKQGCHGDFKNCGQIQLKRRKI